MGEFLGALVAIPSIDRFRIVGPNENMACLISAADGSPNSFLRPVFFLRQIDWAVTQAKKLLAYLSVLLSFPKIDL
jgi:hypothetical protein